MYSRPNGQFSRVAGLRGAQRPNETTSLRARNIEVARDQATSAAVDVRWLTALARAFRAHRLFSSDATRVVRAALQLSMWVLTV
jgi:hypothetical protein